MALYWVGNVSFKSLVNEAIVYCVKMGNNKSDNFPYREVIFCWNWLLKNVWNVTKSSSSAAISRCF